MLAKEPESLLWLLLFFCPGPKMLFWAGLQAKASRASGRIAGEGGGKEACSQWWLDNDYELIKFTQTALSQLSRQQIEKGAQWKTSVVPTHLTAPLTWKQQQLEVLKAAWYDRKGSGFELQLLHSHNFFEPCFPLIFQIRCNGPCWLPTLWLFTFFIPSYQTSISFKNPSCSRKSHVSKESALNPVLRRQRTHDSTNLDMVAQPLWYWLARHEHVP